MTSRVVLFSLTLALVAGARVGADEPFEVQMEFLQRLREKNHAGLAAEYLERLKQNPTPQLNVVLPLEVARNKVALAIQQDSEKRAPLLKQARGELQRFADQNGNRAEGAL